MGGWQILRPHCSGFTSFEAKFYFNILLPVYVGFCFSLVLLLSRCANSFFQEYRLGPAASAVLLHVIDLDYLLGAFGSILETFAIAVQSISFGLLYCYQHPNGKTSLKIAPD